MGLESGVFAALTLGFLLGLKHATDADHVVAVSTIVGRERNLWRSLWIGVSWGAGHSTPLIVLGFVILLLKDTVLSLYESVAPVFEFGGGIMLVYLGINVVWNILRRNVHVHHHTHGDQSHVHIHTSHTPSNEDGDTENHHGLWRLGKPMFRARSYTIGLMHGLAGSAAVMLTLLPTIASIWVGIGYLLLFSVGTMLSMAVITVLIGIPFVATGGNANLSRLVGLLAGSMSCIIGISLMSDVVFDTQIIPF